MTGYRRDGEFTLSARSCRVEDRERNFRGTLTADAQRQPLCAVLGGRVHDSVIRGLPIDIDPGLPAALVPGLLQGIDLVRRRDAGAIQGKDGCPHRDAPAPWTMGSLQHGYSVEVRHGFEVPRRPNPH